MSDIQSNAANEVINEAKAEIAKEVANKNKEKYKGLLKKKRLAEIVLANIDREVADAEIAIRQGNEVC